MAALAALARRFGRARATLCSGSFHGPRFSRFWYRPGSFRACLRLVPAGAQSEWPAQLHDDWLETRITFGFAGTGYLC